MGSGAGAAADGVERWTGPQQPLRCFALQIWGDGAAAVRSSRRTGAVADGVARADWGGSGWRCAGRRGWRTTSRRGGRRWRGRRMQGLEPALASARTRLLPRLHAPNLARE
uniref:Uncharacterized protein n=1 Tax=Oryza brachyantha TaxID=4533 RepID=J3LVK0_ORYBR